MAPAFSKPMRLWVEAGDLKRCEELRAIQVAEEQARAETKRRAKYHHDRTMWGHCFMFGMQCLTELACDVKSGMDFLIMCFQQDPEYFIENVMELHNLTQKVFCLLYTSPSPRD